MNVQKFLVLCEISKCSANFIKVTLFYLDFIVNCVDDLSCLLDEVFAGHVLHRQLLDLGRRSLLSLAGSAAIVTVENATRFDAKQLKM